MASTSPDKQRRRPGEVRDAIVIAFREAGRPMTVGEIRAAVEDRLRGSVPASSIRSYLNLNCGEGKLFDRVGRGEYQLNS